MWPYISCKNPIFACFYTSLLFFLSHYTQISCRFCSYQSYINGRVWVVSGIGKWVLSDCCVVIFFYDHSYFVNSRKGLLLYAYYSIRMRKRQKFPNDDVSWNFVNIVELSIWPASLEYVWWKIQSVDVSLCLFFSPSTIFPSFVFLSSYCACATKWAITCCLIHSKSFGMNANLDLSKTNKTTLFNSSKKSNTSL